MYIMCRRLTLSLPIIVILFFSGCGLPILSMYTTPTLVEFSRSEELSVTAGKGQGRVAYQKGGINKLSGEPSLPEDVATLTMSGVQLTAVIASDATVLYQEKYEIWGFGSATKIQLPAGTYTLAATLFTDNLRSSRSGMSHYKSLRVTEDLKKGRTYMLRGTVQKPSIYDKTDWTWELDLVETTPH